MTTQGTTGACAVFLCRFLDSSAVDNHVITIMVIVVCINVRLQISIIIICFDGDWDFDSAAPAFYQLN